MPVVIQDSFMVASDTTLASHAPDVGTGWTLRANSTTVRAQARAATDDLAPDGGDNNASLVYTAQPGPSAAEYDVEIKLVNITNNGQKTFILIGRWTDDDNYYGVAIRADFNDNALLELELWKRAGGVNTELASTQLTAAQWTNGTSVVKLELRDAAKKVYVDGVERLSSTDNALAAAGEAGLGWGAVFISTGDIDAARSVVDDFVVTEVAAGGVVTVTKAGLAFTGRAITQRQALVVTRAALDWTGRAARLRQMLAVTAAGLDWIGRNVGVGFITTIAVGKAALELKGRAVTVNAGTLVAVSKTALAWTGAGVVARLFWEPIAGATTAWFSASGASETWTDEPPAGAGWSEPPAASGAWSPAPDDDTSWS